MQYKINDGRSRFKKLQYLGNETKLQTNMKKIVNALVYLTIFNSPST